MNKNNKLTQFNEGGLHSQNPLGGIPIGGNNSVEENETKQNNFVYSNRIFLDSNIVSQYNLPKSLVGKSVADATKFIDNKFKGRNDKISQSTKNGMLSKIAEAQESMKPQEPEMEQAQEGMIDPIQMAFGGYVNRQMEDGGYYDQNNPYFMQNPGAVQKPAQSNTNVVNQIQPVSQLTQSNSLSQIKPFSTGNQLPTTSAVPDTAGAIGGGLKEMSGKTGLGLSSALGAASTAIDLGKTAFGKPAQDTSGLAPSAKVNSGGMIAGSAMKGASAGMAFGPLGAGIGAAIGGVAGLLGSNKAKKAAIENTNNYAVNVNKQFSDQYAMGGEIDPPVKDKIWQTKNIVKYQPGVTSGKNGDSGFYLYSKDNSDSTFDYKTDREFVKNSSMDVVQKTAQWQNYMRSKNKVVNPDINLNLPNPIVNELAYSGKMNQMADGGYYDKNRPYFTTNPGTVVPTNQETVSSNKLVPFPKPQLQGLSFIPPINKEERVAYQRSKGLSAKDATGTLGPKTKAWIASDVMNSIPETPPSVNTGDPIITPTQTLAGFEAYADAKQAEEAAAAEAIKNKKSIAGKALSYTNDNLGNIARYAPIAANALQLAQLKKPQGERLDRLSNRYRPEYVDEAQLQNIANQTMNNSINAVGQSGASQGQLRSSIIGSQLQRTKAISDAYSQAAAQNRQQNAMAQEFNLGVDQVNLNQSNTEKDINARDQAAYRNAKREYITGIGEGIGDIGKEQTYKKIIAKTTGYKWDGEYVKSPDGTVVTDPATGKPMTEEKLKEIQSIKDKKALGGYLIKNRKQ